MAEARTERGTRSTLVAAGLSFLFPGLGQAYQRRSRVALVLAVPTVVVLLLLASPLIGRLELAALQLLDPQFAGPGLLAVAALGFWRALAVWDAWRQPASGQQGRRSVGTLGALITAIAVMHAAVGYYAWSFYDAGSKIFTGDRPTPTVPASTAAPGKTPPPSASPGPTQPARDRITILLLGVDSGHARQFANTDTMLIASISLSRGTMTMVSFPRDITRFPLYFGGNYHDKLNSLMSVAAKDPAHYPDGPSRTLANELGFLLGIPIDYTASMNLEGFEQMISTVGGVDIDNEVWIDDPLYDWFDGTFGFKLSPGPHHLNGRQALAFVRSRRGAGDNDFKRADRQQQLLLALKSKMTQPDVIAKLPELLEIAGRTVATDLPPDVLRQSVGMVADINAAKVQRVVLGPPYSHHPPTTSTGGIYTLVLQMDKVEALSVELFGSDSAYAAGAGGPSLFQ
jgi:LCP family protein required for cell wall assembly